MAEQFSELCTWECRECDVQWKSADPTCWCCGTDIAAQMDLYARPSKDLAVMHASRAGEATFGTPLTRYGIRADVEGARRAAALGLPDPRAPRDERSILGDSAA